MKSMILIALTFFAFNTFADIKPDGALLADMCGDNVAETPLMGPTYPVEVCTWTVNGNQPNAMMTTRPIFSVKDFAGNTTFYMALGQFQVEDSVFKWQGYKLNVVRPGAYYFIDSANPIDLNNPMKEITMIWRAGGAKVVGPMIEADLEIMYHTLTTEVE